MAYNEAHGIVPKTIVKPIKNTLEITKKAKDTSLKKLSKADTQKEIDRLNALMKIASDELDFETAIKLRDEIKLLKGQK